MAKKPKTKPQQIDDQEACPQTASQEDLMSCQEHLKAVFDLAHALMRLTNGHMLEAAEASVLLLLAGLYNEIPKEGRPSVPEWTTEIKERLETLIKFDMGVGGKKRWNG